MRLGVFLLLIILFQQISAQSIKQDYDLFLWGNKIGNVKTEKRLLADTGIVYLLESNTKAKVLWINRSVYTRNLVEFRHGKIHSVDYNAIEDGKPWRWTKISRHPEGYLVESAAGKKLLRRLPFNCIATIYFHGMPSGTEMLDETGAGITSLTPKGPACVEYKGLDGSKNIFWYKNGRVEKAEFHMSIATVSMLPSP
jgi:hypothetical protein